MIDPIARLKGFVLRLTCPLFYKSIGRRTIFYGRVRVPLPRRNIIIGNDCMIGDSVYFYAGRVSELTIGNNCSINTGCHIVAAERINIGDNVAIGEYVSIRDQEHRFHAGGGVRGQGYNIEPITIAANVWIGRGVYIGPGTLIQSGTIVGANSVVRGKFPPNVLLAGAPAVVKRVLSDGNPQAMSASTGESCPV